MTDAPTTFHVRPAHPFRERFAVLLATPSSTIRAIADQADARRELVPLGATAAELRARGYEVSALVPDAAVLRTQADDTAWRVSRGVTPDEMPPTLTASTGRLTGLVWGFDLEQHLAWIAARAGCFGALTAEELTEEHQSLTRAGITSMQRGETDLVGEIVVRLGEIEAEAEQRLARMLRALPN